MRAASGTGGSRCTTKTRRHLRHRGTIEAAVATVMLILRGARSTLPAAGTVFDLRETGRHRRTGTPAKFARQRCLLNFGTDCLAGKVAAPQGGTSAHRSTVGWVDALGDPPTPTI